MRLCRWIREIERKTAGDAALTARFAPLRSLAVRILFQHHPQRGQKVYALHAPEVECIGKGKPGGVLSTNHRFRQQRSSHSYRKCFSIWHRRNDRRKLTAASLPGDV